MMNCSEEAFVEKTGDRSEREDRQVRGHARSATYCTCKSAETLQSTKYA